MYDIESGNKFIVEFFVKLQEIYWSLFIKIIIILSEKYTIVFGENHYHAIFTALLLLYIASQLLKIFYKPNYRSTDLFDQFNYLKQKLKYQENNINILFNALESTEKKFKTMETKIKKLERELKKYD